MGTSKKNASETPALGPRIPLTLDVDLPGLAESLTSHLDTPEKLVAFLQLLDAEYQDFDFTMAAGKWFVREIKESYAADGEKCDLEEVFAEDSSS